MKNRILIKIRLRNFVIFFAVAFVVLECWFAYLLFASDLEEKVKYSIKIVMIAWATAVPLTAYVLFDD